MRTDTHTPFVRPYLASCMLACTSSDASLAYACLPRSFIFDGLPVKISASDFRVITIHVPTIHNNLLSQ